MKNFWLKLDMRTKVILMFFLFVIFLSFVGWSNYQPPEANSTADNSDYVNSITNRNPILSYPISYSNIWSGKIELFPDRVRELDYALSSSDQCGGITRGMDVYYTSEVDSIMVITNKNLATTDIELSNFNSAKEIIAGNADFDKYNAELSAFRTYCSYFSLYKIDEFEIDYPNTEHSRAILGIGLRQTNVDSINGIGLYIYVYGSKGDYLIQLSRSLQGGFLYNQSNWDTCKSKSLQSDQNECLANIYKNEPSMKSKVESEIQNLINVFALPNGE
ncbi:MAG: hypothetical protein IAE91_09825 [Ignavibacteriaceae bacterium]|nr:hypothetical protein [Ignavibacteriaceae bacterium]